MDSEGNQQIRKFCEFGVTLDERIGDGVYFANSVGLIEKMLQNPELLNDPIAKSID